MPPTPFVAIVLSTELKPRVIGLGELASESGDIELDGRTFKCLSAGGWLGFYDWLRDRSGRVVGVRQYIDDLDAFPWDRPFRGASRGVGKRELLIFFDDEHAFDENSSCDQDFGDNFLFAHGNLIAITLSATGLGPAVV